MIAPAKQRQMSLLATWTMKGRDTYKIQSSCTVWASGENSCIAVQEFSRDQPKCPSQLQISRNANGLLSCWAATQLFAHCKHPLHPSSIMKHITLDTLMGTC